MKILTTHSLGLRWGTVSACSLPRGEQLLKTLIFFICMFPSGLVAKDYMVLSQKLASLRVEVEELNRSLKEIRQQHSSELRSHSLQKAELGASVRKEEIRQEQLRLKIETLRSELSQGQPEELKFLVFTYVEKLSNWIQKSLPFRREERLSNVKKIQGDLEGGNIGSYQAFSSLWLAMEDERRLAIENQLARGSISMSGKSYLAELVHLGGWGLFFKLEDGTYGKAMKLSDDEWKFNPLQRREETRAIRDLFAGMKKKIQTGEYLVPTR